MNVSSTRRSDADICRPVFLFDGQCGFCRKWARRLARITKGRVPIEPYQSMNLLALGVTEEQCSTAVQFIDGDGRVGAGAVAVGRHLVAVGGPWRLVGGVLLLPGIRHMAGAIYRWVARNRHRFRGEP